MTPGKHTVAVLVDGKPVAVDVPTLPNGWGTPKHRFKVHDEALRDRSVTVHKRYVVSHVVGGFRVRAFARRTDALQVALWANANAPHGLFAFGRNDPQGSPGVPELMAFFDHMPPPAPLEAKELARLSRALARKTALPAPKEAP